MADKFHRIYWSKEFDWKEYAKRYNQYCKTKGNYYEKSSKFLLEITPLNKNEIILDLGCGTGVMSKEILRKYPYIRIFANDLSKEALEYYKKNFKREIETGQIRVIEGNAENINSAIREKIDKIFISSALWDMEIKALFSNLKNILKENGEIYANLPSLTIGKNEGFIYEIERFFRKKAKIEKLYRRISLKELKKILNDNNFAIKKLIKYQFSLTKENISKFFEVLKYRYPFIFFPDKIGYKERYEKCKVLFEMLLKNVPGEGIYEKGVIISIKHKS